MLKKLLLIVVAACLVGAVAILWITRDIGASHPNLAKADLPRLIPTYAFYADPRSAYDYVPSPDGKYVAFRKSDFQGGKVTVRDLKTGEEFGDFPINISGIRWHAEKPHLRFIHRGDDWEANPRDSNPAKWKKISPVSLTGGWHKPNFEDDATSDQIVWGKTNFRAPGHLWKVSQDGAQSEKLAEGNQNTQYWILDTEDQPALRIDTLDPATQRMFRKTGETWEQLIDLDLDDTFEMWGEIDSDGKITARSSRGRDKIAWVAFDTANGSEEVLIENPNNDIGVPSAYTPKNAPDVLRTGVSTFDRVALTPKGQVILDVLANFEQPISLYATHPSPGGRFVTQAFSPNEKAMVYVLIDLETGDHTVIDRFHFGRYNDALVAGRWVTVPARDKLDLPAILTLPQGVEGPIPFVVVMHGGPAQHFSGGYNHDVQFLANRGYGVLLLNSRGSTGFGKAFQAAGFREYGRKMQDDIADAAHWLVDQGLADTDALVVMGTSYGGYAAGMAMTRDPDLFDAAIVEFPMLDVEFQGKYHPATWKPTLNLWWRYFGKPDNPEDVALMREFSPVNRVDQIHGPMLVLGGEKDQITAIQQVRDFEAALKGTEKDVTFAYFPDAGHGVDKGQDNVRRARLIEDFLAKHAGGRSGGRDLSEFAFELVQ